MLRKGLIVLAMILACQGPAFAQGFFDSIFGSGGLGLYESSGPGNQWNSPQFYGGSQMPGAANGQMYGQSGPLPATPPGAPPPQGYAPPAQAPAYGQDYSTYSQPGLYSDWNPGQAAPVGPQAVEQYNPQPEQYGQPVQQQYPPQQYPPQQYPPQQYPPQAQQAYPPQQYAPPGQPQYPPQEYAPPQPQPARQQPRAKRQPARQRQAAPAPAPAPAPAQAQYAAPQGQPQQPPLRPGQYSPGQPPDQDTSVAESLPAGAVQVTTSTPQGTYVEYFPPAGGPPPGQMAPAPPQRPRRAAPAAKPRGPRAQAKEQPAAAGDSEGVASIAMPKPVEIPQGLDPRAGWGAAR